MGGFFDAIGDVAGSLFGGVAKLFTGLASGLLGGKATAAANPLPATPPPSVAAIEAPALRPEPAALASTPAAPIMPVPDDQAAKIAARRALAQRRSSVTSRQSSILSQGVGGGTDSLGG